MFVSVYRHDSLLMQFSNQFVFQFHQYFLNKFQCVQIIPYFYIIIYQLHWTSIMGCTGSDSHLKAKKSKKEELTNQLKGCNTEITTLKGQLNELEIMFVGKSMPGWRQENEDTFVFDLISENLALFAIFDGHSGLEISLFAKLYFGEILRKNESFQKGEYQKALEESFIQVDQLLSSREGITLLENIQKSLQLQGYSTNGGNPEYMSGSTALVALITKKEIFIANAGDCKSIFIKNNQIIGETIDHRADHPQERSRITANGGEIIDGRIFGDLNVSRGFGDFAHKPGTNLEKHIVSVMPDIYKYKVEQIDYMLLGSDGIWERSPQQVWSSIQIFVSEKERSEKNICFNLEDSLELFLTNSLGKSKIDTFGTDNMTAILIKFGIDARTFSNASTAIIP